MSKGHAFLPPSGAHCWRWCPLWPTMVERFPQAPTEEGREGDAAHWCNALPEAPALGSLAPNGVQVTSAMLQGRALWRHCLAEMVAPRFEAHVFGGSIHRTLNHGTPDHWSFDGHTVYVDDYKFGFEPVEVFENWQGLNYLSLVMDTLGMSNGVHDQAIGARFRIIQPRAYHRDGPVREWRIKRLSDLRGSFNQLREAADRATSPQHQVGIVGTHCKHCPGRHACDALQRNTATSIDTRGSSLPLELTPEALGVELRELRRTLKLLQARESGLTAQAEATLLRGQRVPGFAMEPKQGRTVWLHDAPTIAAIGTALGHALQKTEVITPTQAIAMGMPESVVAGLSHTPRSGLALVEDDGKLTRKLFGA